MTHGFVVDGQGRKFSKSLGNGVTPTELLGKYGMDIIRLWVGSSDYAEEVRYSPAHMEAAADQYRTIRNSLRWLLGNLPEGGGDVADVAEDKLPELERYILHRLHSVLAEVRGHYDAFQFHQGVRALQTFISTELSNLYFDVRKDTLYCDRADSPDRVACVYALEQIFRGLTTHFAPVIPFTTDEAWRCRYGENACVHLEEYAVGPKTKSHDFWAGLLHIRSQANQMIEQFRAKGEVGSNLEITLNYAGVYDPDLVALVCGVSEAKPSMEIEIAKHPGHKCPRCWRYYNTLEASGLCTRCEGAVNA